MKRIAVVIGRFQVPELHAGHRHLIDSASAESDETLILVGTTEGLPSTRNPLPYDAIRVMLQNAYPSAVIHPFADRPTNELWSRELDLRIGELFPDASVRLYGSRESFIPAYTGKYPCVTVPPVDAPSGTDIRNGLGVIRYEDSSFRAGIIHAQSLRLPVSYQAVDIAVIRHPQNEILLGRKRRDGGKFRFIGGFVDPTDSSLEGAALRELREEAGRIDCHEVSYLGSFRVNDYRYRDGEDRVMTTLFAAYHLAGIPKAGDDLDEVVWMNAKDVIGSVVANHIPLAERLAEFLNQKTEKGDRHEHER